MACRHHARVLLASEMIQHRFAPTVSLSCREHDLVPLVLLTSPPGREFGIPRLWQQSLAVAWRARHATKLVEAAESSVEELREELNDMARLRKERRTRWLVANGSRSSHEFDYSSVPQAPSGLSFDGRPLWSCMQVFCRPLLETASMALRLGMTHVLALLSGLASRLSATETWSACAKFTADDILLRYIGRPGTRAAKDESPGPQMATMPSVSSLGPAVTDTFVVARWFGEGLLDAMPMDRLPWRTSAMTQKAQRQEISAIHDNLLRVEFGCHALALAEAVEDSRRAEMLAFIEEHIVKPTLFDLDDTVRCMLSRLVIVHHLQRHQVDVDVIDCYRPDEFARALLTLAGYFERFVDRRSPSRGGPGYQSCEVLVAAESAVAKSLRTERPTSNNVIVACAILNATVGMAGFADSKTALAILVAVLEDCLLHHRKAGGDSRPPTLLSLALDNLSLASILAMLRASVVYKAIETLGRVTIGPKNPRYCHMPMEAKEVKVVHGAVRTIAARTRDKTPNHDAVLECATYSIDCALVKMGFIV
ncbi:hypothetical protein ml_100 [Mollivirus sibericum]|uniref:hypothetical protein n=1 Tax=Mollivirus sibericum TaxID=1678078 RepID=UPI0006B2E18A|nr:hypothetical protein ml_100 [Mollivirus sibericum]ALD61902.1 hypothetical protein ml_100 [Mollivirus sibericum]